jgi:hypothetical protein
VVKSVFLSVFRAEFTQRRLAVVKALASGVQVATTGRASRAAAATVRRRVILIFLLQSVYESPDGTRVPPWLAGAASDGRRL